MNQGLSTRIQRLVASPIRDLLSAIDKPKIVSFAGGLPATHNLPDIGSEFAGDITRSTLQYGASEGESTLREHIAKDLQQRGLHVDSAQVIVLSGSQQGIDLVAKLTIDEGTSVAVESPTYLAALQTFGMFGADYLPYDVDALDEAFTDRLPALVYTNPTFRNPDSIVYSATQRSRLAAVCDQLGTILFEDDPYRDLIYEGRMRRPVCAFLKRARWIYQSSFSKTLAPGLRLGYLVCSPDLYTPLLHLKQAADLHSNRLSQYLVLRLLQVEGANKRLTAIREDYRVRRDHFDELLTRHLGDIAYWTRPAGGLFFWLQLKTKKSVNTRELLPRALAAGVVFMPGEPFFADGRQAANALRLNFSHVDPSKAEHGLRKLADLLRAEV